ncbi:MAG: hypothetical protein AAF674_06150 [Pseudomonadota bacterium]
MRWLIAILLLLLLPPLPALACGEDSRCEVDGGYYLVAEPPDWDGQTPLPVVVYFHGWNSSPEGTFRNGAMINGVTGRGGLFVVPWAPNGYWRQIGPGRDGGGRDEAAFIRAVMADVTARWPTDPALTMTSGFSRGGSTSWNVACYLGDMFAGHAPIAGGFWNQTPGDCPTGAVNLRHIHGLSDRVVAYDEVGIYNSMPIPEGWALLRRLDGASAQPDATYVLDHPKRPRTCKRHDGTSGRVLEICLHPGGHSIPGEWVGEGLDWLRSLPASARQVGG